jgi:D-inositol-3-phosphate glycosyltransferase
MKKEKISLLLLMDYKATTGFATVSGNIIPYFKKHFGEALHLDIIAINYFGKAYDADGGRTRVYSAAQTGKKPDAFGRYEYLRMLAHYEYDATVIMQDYGVVLPIVEVMESINSQKKKKFKTFFYFPVDHVPYHAQLYALEAFDRLATYTAWGHQEILRQVATVQSRLDVIPHGVDTQDFFPMAQAEKQAFRREYFGENADKFIIGNINRNQPRKDIPSTIFSFQLYKEKYNPNAFLYLHMNPLDQMGWNLPSILDQAGLRQDLDYKLATEKESLCPVDQLNRIYNSLDFFLSTTSGEGWGLSVTEAMACKVPVMAPNHTSLMEIGGTFLAEDERRMWLINDLRPYVSHFDNMLRHSVDYKTVPILLDIAVRHPERTARLVDNAYQYVQTLQWEAIAGQWISVVESLLK